MDDLIYEIDIAEVIEAAEDEIRLLDYINAFEISHFKCLLARHEFETAMKAITESFRKCSEMLEEWKFRECVKNPGMVIRDEEDANG